MPAVIAKTVDAICVFSGVIAPSHSTEGNI